MALCWEEALCLIVVLHTDGHKLNRRDQTNLQTNGNATTTQFVHKLDFCTVTEKVNSNV